jgi:hypothetical protein
MYQSSIIDLHPKHVVQRVGGDALINIALFFGYAPRNL